MEDTAAPAASVMVPIYNFERYLTETFQFLKTQTFAELKALNEKTSSVSKKCDDPRVTRLGRLLRRVSLEELPQLTNVLKGELPVAGPRPTLSSEVATRTLHRCLLIKSGITCYWQTLRNPGSITFAEWVDVGLPYIKQCSAWADLKLIIQTVGCVLTAQGS